MAKSLASPRRTTSNRTTTQASKKGKMTMTKKATKKATTKTIKGKAAKQTGSKMDRQITMGMATKIVSKTSLVCQAKREALAGALVSHGRGWAVPYGRFCAQKEWKFNKRLVTTVNELIAS